LTCQRRLAARAAARSPRDWTTAYGIAVRPYGRIAAAASVWLPYARFAVVDVLMAAAEARIKVRCAALSRIALCQLPKEGLVSAESVNPIASTKGTPVSSPSSTARLEIFTQRVGPVAGILGVILLYAGLFVHGYPNANTAELVKWTATTDPTRFRIGIYMEATGLLLLLAFFSWLADLMRRGEAAGWLVRLAFGSALIWVGVGVTTNGIWTAVLDAGKRERTRRPLPGCATSRRKAITPRLCLLW
jgi:hypothetical protein